MKCIFTLCLVSSFALVGCGTAPLVQNRINVQFPEPPQSSDTKCANLQMVPNDARMQDLISVVSNNYEAYHDCNSKNSAWVEWYVKQREIFNSKKLYQ